MIYFLGEQGDKKSIRGGDNFAGFNMIDLALEFRDLDLANYLIDNKLSFPSVRSFCLAANFADKDLLLKFIN